MVYADLETGEYFHFIRGQQQVGIGHLNGLLATRDSLFVADLVTTGNMGDGSGKGVIYQIKSLLPPPPPELTVKRIGSSIELKWDRGKLQKTGDLTGLWEDLTGIFSPLLVEPAGPRKFYRAGY